MRIIDRYLLILFGRLFCLCLGSFTAIYLVIDFLEKYRRFSRADASLSHMLLFFGWEIPGIINQTAPLAVLMATVLTIGTLARTSELVAMQSAGISLPRIAAPLVACSIAISLLLLAGSELLLPTAAEQLTYTEQVLIARKPPSAAFRQDNIWYRDDTFILRARKFDPDRQTLSGITVWRVSADFLPLQRLDAVSGQLVAAGWELRDVVTRDIVGGGISGTSGTPRLVLPLDLRPADLKAVKNYAENLSFSRLRQYVAKLRESGYDASRYETLMHARLAQPFAALVMAGLGIPFALRSHRSSGIARGVGLSMALGFAYFVTNAICIALGQSTALPAPLAGWAANLAFLALGGWLTLKPRH
jgi:lipopolysaccharide export system permease protein